MKTRHNPERRAWRGRSYKKNGRRIAALREPRLSSRDLGVCIKCFATMRPCALGTVGCTVVHIFEPRQP